MERPNPKYRFPIYKALPKDWEFSHDAPFSKRWKNWHVRVVEGSYVTYYTYHPYIFGDDKSREEFENEARRHFIYCEDGTADYNMPKSFHMVEIDPDTLCQDTGISYQFTWTPPHKHTSTVYTARLFEHDIVEFEIQVQPCRPPLKGVGEVVWKGAQWEIQPLVFHKDEETGFAEETPVPEKCSLHFRAYDLNTRITKMYGTRFELEHHNDIWADDPDNDPFKDLAIL